MASRLAIGVPSVAFIEALRPYWAFISSNHEKSAVSCPP
jgi:hypothetical protein